MKVLIIILIIVAIKGIFSAAETAFAHLSKSKIHQMSKKDKKAKKVYEMLEDNHKFFGLAEVGVVVCEILASAVAAETYVHHLKLNFENIGLTIWASNIFAVIIVTIILSYFLLVFGALLPKKIARLSPEKTMLRLINILYALSFITYLFERIATYSSNIICKIFNIKETKEQLTDKEIKMIIQEGKDQGVIDKFEKDILMNALKYNNTKVKDFMVQKEKASFINSKSDKETILQNVAKYTYTRIPVYEGIKDTVIGILNVKDIAIEYAKNKNEEIDINKLIRPATFIEGEEKIMNAFKQMQLNKQQMLIVVNKERKVIGIITMEDIIEILMGKILDEDDKK